MGSFSLGGAMAVAGTAMSIASSLGLGARLDPELAHSFTVEIDGLIVGGFAEVSGLNAKVETVKIPNGGQNSYEEQRINGAKYPNLILKRGLTTADMLWLWYGDVVTGKIERHNGSIVLMTKDLLELWRWDFRDAYPVSWTGPSLKADQSVVAFESIELVHRGLSKDLGPFGSPSAGSVSVGLTAGASFL
jgi:phage tail-like protein